MSGGMTQRRARDRDGKPIEPMTLANMRALGVQSVMAICEEVLCGHSANLSAVVLPDALPVPDIALRENQDF